MDGDDIFAYSPEQPSHLPLWVNSCGHSSWNKGHAYARDGSRAFAVEQVIEGVIKFTQDDRSFMVHPGEVYLLQKGSNHKYEVAGDKRVIKRSATIEGTLLPSLLEDLHLKSVCYVQPRNPSHITQLFKKIVSLSQRKPPRYVLAGGNIVYELLVELGLSCRPAFPRVIHEAIDQINAELSTSLYAGDLAQKSGLSLVHFNRLFQKHVGVTPTKFIFDARMQKACHLLSQTNLTIAEIASQSGFKDALYFSARFKKVYSRSPKHWRKSGGRGGVAKKQ